MNKKNIKDIDIQGKRLLIRVDFNVPLDEELNVVDDTRIKSALPTIQYALENNAAVILMSHLGRPKGKVVENLRLNPVKDRLGKLIGRPVLKVDDCIGENIKQKLSKIEPGFVALLENLRFHPEEEKNDPDFSKQLASLGDIYVNDAFGTAHRAHASTHGVAQYLPACSGFLLEKEITYLGKVLEKPEKPFVTILGGAKVSDKILVIENLIEKVDGLIIGGGMAYTFLKAQGKDIGNSKLEADKIDYAKELLEKIKAKGVKLALPIDNICAENLEPTTNTITIGDDIPDGYIAADVGPKTVDLFKDMLRDAKTILWNGPIGIFEMQQFASGTASLAGYIAKLDATKIIGGGDTASAIAQLMLEEKMSHVSTGGGASLEFLEGKELPGIACLQDK